MRVSTGEGTSYVEANENMDHEEVLEAIKMLAKAYYEITGAMPPTLSRKMIGVERTPESRLRSAALGMKRWRSRRGLKLVKETR